MKGLAADQLAFIACCIVNLVDLMGMSFTSPALIPYGQSLGASTAQIASFQTVRFAVGFVSMIWMPRLADRRGVKFVIMISIVGSGIAYAIQGVAHLFVQYEAGVTVMIVGRAISGFFGGTQPVLRSFVTMLSLPDLNVLKFRLTFLFAFAQAGNFALAPIAGLLTRWGLYLPWYVSAGVAALVFVFAGAFFQNAEDVKQKQAAHLAKPLIDVKKKSSVDAEVTKTDVETAMEEPQGQLVEPPKPEQLPEFVGPTPGKDKILYVLMLAHIFIFCTVSALVMILPLLLEYPSYGLMDPDSEEQSRANLASATSLAMVPHGICNLMFSTFGFLMISGRIGDRNTMRLGGAVATILFSLYGFATQSFWEICLLHGLAGVAIGLFVPAISPTLQLYSKAAHPNNLAQASSMPMFGLTVGFVIGPLIFSAIIGEQKERYRMNLAWLLAGICFAIGTLLFEISFTMINRHPAMKRLKMSPRQVRIALESGAQDEEEFVDEMCTLLRAMMTKGDPQCRNLHLWHGNAQKFIRRLLDDTLPHLREYDEKTEARSTSRIAQHGWPGRGPPRSRRGSGTLFHTFLCRPTTLTSIILALSTPQQVWTLVHLR